MTVAELIAELSRLPPGSEIEGVEAVTWSADPDGPPVPGPRGVSFAGPVTVSLQ